MSHSSMIQSPSSSCSWCIHCRFMHCGGRHNDTALRTLAGLLTPNPSYFLLFTIIKHNSWAMRCLIRYWQNFLCPRGTKPCLEVWERCLCHCPMPGRTFEEESMCLRCWDGDPGEGISTSCIFVMTEFLEKVGNKSGLTRSKGMNPIQKRFWLLIALSKDCSSRSLIFKVSFSIPRGS